MFKRLSAIFQSPVSKNKKLKVAIKQIVGVEPVHIELYLLAIKHISTSKEVVKGIKENNERLEFLGDSILGMVVAEYLFKKFPYKDEGFLTEIRARIVNGESLSVLAKKTGIDKLVEFENNKNPVAFKSVYGDALEALVGAIYLDHGIKVVKLFIIKRLIDQHIDINTIIENNNNFKSKLIEWAHKENKEVRFKITGESGKGNHKQFTAQAIINDEYISEGAGLSKKKAEQDAAMKACDFLKL